MRKLLVFLSFITLIADAIAAQQAQDSTDVFFRHLQLNETVVTGIAGQTRLKEMPSPVSLISPSRLKGRPATNIINALAAEPGMSEITTGGGISKPVIRGLGYNRVLVIDDGVRQEGQQWGDEHGIEIDRAGIYSVEILKGPASLMYGSDALAGIIIFHPDPASAPGTFNGNFSSEYQTNNGLAALSLSASGNKNGWIWDGRYSDNRAHSYRNRADGAVPNSEFSERAASATIGKNGNWGNSRLKLSWFHLVPGMIEGDRDPLTGELQGEDNGYSVGLPFQKVNHLKLISDNTFRLANGNIKTILGWQRNRRQEFEESASESGLDFLLNTLTYDVRFLSDGSRGWKSAFGAGGMLQRSDNLGEEFLIPSYSLADAGVFATTSHGFGAWIVSGGLRADIRTLHSEALAGRFEEFSRSYTGITGSLGAVRPLGEDFVFRVNVARGFRAPNLSELASNGEHEGTFRYEVGNNGLKPEYSLQGDAGIDFNGRLLSANLSLFASRIDNYIYSARNGEMTPEGLPVFIFRSGLAFMDGGEISFDFHPVHSLHLGGAFSYVSGKDSEGDWLPLIPAPRLTTELMYEFNHGSDHLLSNIHAGLNLDWNLAQNRFYGRDGTETATPAYALLGATAGADLFIRGKRRASFSIIGTNLTDEIWQSHLSRLKYTGFNPVTGRQGISNMGRNIIFRLTVPFGHE